MSSTVTGAASRTQAQSPAPALVPNLARALGWFSVGLGVAEMLAPRTLGNFIGIRGQVGLLRGLGFREVAHGVAILSKPNTAPLLWARVAGDALDIALLGRALVSKRHESDRVAAALMAVIGVTILDAAAARQLAQANANAPTRRGWAATRMTKTVTVNRPRVEVYRFWRNLENLPRFMTHLESVRVIDERRSHWRVKGPVGRAVEWESEITDDRANERIAWRSRDGADVANRGSVEFRDAPGERGTEVCVDLEYEMPGGSAAATMASLVGEAPSQKLSADLRALKAVLEAGEIPRADSSFGLFRHAARPSRKAE
jgi:uncharacterized membrane protein